MDLITLDEYKDANGINSTTNDMKISSLIESASQLVKTYCGNSIVDYYSSDFVETISVNWSSPYIQLTEGPVKNISIAEERLDMASDYTTLQNSEFYLDPVTDTIVRSNGTVPTLWPQGPGSVRVTYTAGYESTPADLRLAVVDLVTYYLKDEHKLRKTLSGATLDNPGTSTQYRNVGFPDHIKRVLDLYRHQL